MKKHRIGALIAAGALTLTFAGTAFANNLHQTPPIVGTQFENTKVGCDEGWHFVHTNAKAGSLPSTLTATFQGAGQVQVAGYVNGNSIVMYNVYVDPSDTLLSASDSISNDGNLNLSHVCLPGEETETTETESTETESTETESTETESTETETTSTETTSTETTVTSTTETSTIETETTETTDSVESTTETTDSVESTTETTESVESETESKTPPATDALAGGDATVSGSLWALLVGAAGILAGVLLLTPKSIRNRR